MISSQSRNLGWAIVTVTLLAASVYSLHKLNLEHQRSLDLEASNRTLSASLRQTQSEIENLSDRLNQLSAQSSAVQPPAPSPAVSAPVPFAPSPKPRKATPTARRAVPVAKPPDDPRWHQVQSELENQKKAIADTQAEVARSHDELQGKLDSTRDDLDGSIARNHEELVALQKRGERSYYEFQLDRSKQLTRVGPVSLSLRKVDTKHGNYDLVMMVDDRQLQKKHVNVFEPVLLTVADRSQPIELVVNHVEKNQVKGYLSEPKYRKSELAAAATSGAGTTPAAPDNSSRLQRR